MVHHEAVALLTQLHFLLTRTGLNRSAPAAPKDGLVAAIEFQWNTVGVHPMFATSHATSYARWIHATPAKSALRIHG